jgi:hypothetical protein
VNQLREDTSTNTTAEQTTIGQFWPAPIENYRKRRHRPDRTRRPQRLHRRPPACSPCSTSASPSHHRSLRRQVRLPAAAQHRHPGRRGAGSETSPLGAQPGLGPDTPWRRATADVRRSLSVVNHSTHCQSWAERVVTGPTVTYDCRQRTWGRGMGNRSAGLLTRRGAQALSPHPGARENGGLDGPCVKPTRSHGCGDRTRGGNCTPLSRGRACVAVRQGSGGPGSATPLLVVSAALRPTGRRDVLRTVGSWGRTTDDRLQHDRVDRAPRAGAERFAARLDGQARSRQARSRPDGGFERYVRRGGCR